MRTSIVSKLLLLMFLVGAASGFFLSAVAWWGLHSGARDLARMQHAGSAALARIAAVQDLSAVRSAVALTRAEARLQYQQASERNRDALDTLLAMALLSTVFFCATAALTWRQAQDGRKKSLQLGREHALFKTLFDGTSDAILLLAKDQIIDCNNAALRLFGATGVAALTRAGLARLQPHYQPDGSASEPAWRNGLEAAVAAHASPRFEWNFQSLQGQQFTAEVTISSATVGSDSIVQLIVRNISERKLAENTMRLANQAFENSLEGIAIVDAGRNIVTVNRAFTTITGYAPEEVVGKNPRLLNSGRQSPQFYEDMWAALAARQEWQGEIWNIRKNGEIYPQWLNITEVRDQHGKTANYVCVFSDISELKAAHASNLHAVYHDRLTELPNSVLFTDRLHQLFAQSRAQPEQRIALMYLDLDRLKVVNDSMGREAGDQLLQMVATRLKQSIRAGDTLARMNGDEFAVLLSDIGSAEDAVGVASHILHSFEQPFPLNGEPIHVSLSIGISVYPTDCTGADALLQNAAMAMYRAKKSGGLAYEMYDRELGAEAGKRLAIETGLRQALEHQEMELHYQPQFECHSGKLIGFEALLRWRHSEHGLLSPGVFLPIAEETGLIVPIGAWVLQTACAQAQAWRQHTQQHRLMAVNLSARQLQHPDIVQHVISALDNSGLPANCLELEITESMMMHDVDACVDIMHRLSVLGVEFSIDDFGTGYSSLAYLKKMPIKALKIDQSFIRDIAGNADGATIVGAIVAMSDSLGLRVVAEGIDDPAQLEHLKERYGQIIGQGFLLGRPAAPAAIGALLATMAANDEAAQLMPSL